MDPVVVKDPPSQRAFAALKSSVSLQFLFVFNRFGLYIDVNPMV